MTQKLTLTKVCLGLLVIASLLLASEAIGSEKFTPSPPPPAGKALVYVYRHRKISTTHPLIFVNDYLLAEMHNSNYAAIYVPQGAMVVAATIPTEKYFTVPSPTGEWASLPGCRDLDWRRLAGGRPRDIQVCTHELWVLVRECASYTTESGCRGPGCLLITTRHVPACYNKLFGFSPDTFELLDLALGLRPILKGAPLAPAPRNPYQQLDASEFDTALRMEVEAGKTYYIRYSLARAEGKFEVAGESTGAKEINGLHFAEFGGWIRLSRMLAPITQPLAPPPPHPPSAPPPPHPQSARDKNAEKPVAHSEFMRAVVQGDLAKVQALLKDNPGLVLSADERDMTPLHWAAISGHKDVAELLLAHGADVSARSSFSDAPLDEAVRGGHKEVVELLLAHGADINAKDGFGDTPLHEAAEHDFKDMAELLLAHGADVNAENNAHRTPLREVEGKGYKDVEELLRQHGGSDALAKGRSVPSTPSADPLPGRPAETPTPDDEFQGAVRQGDLAKVQVLLKDHPDLVICKDDRGDTPLHGAAISGHKDVAELLLANKAEVDAKGDGGRTPLYRAVFSSQKDVAELLLAHGADINTKDDYGHTPLHRAVLAGNNGLVEFLLAHGADINARDDSYGYTPLHRAVLAGNNGLVEFLLAHGADVNAETESHATPLGLAKTMRDKEMAEVLRQHGGQIRVPRGETKAKAD
jgi:cytohesin